MNKLHPKSIWLFFSRYLIRLFIVLVIIFASVVNVLDVFSAKGGMAKLFLILGGFLVIALLFNYIWARLSYNFYKYELTDRAFRKEYGVISKKYVSIPYKRVQNVDISRSLWARILGLSVLKIQTAGENSASSGKIGIGMYAEGVLPGVSKEKAEDLREKIIQKARSGNNQAL